MLYKGIIIKKYSDLEDHAINKIQIAQKEGVIQINFTRLTHYNTVFDARLWDYIEVGDSIFKRKDEYKITVKKAYETREFDIDCDDFKKRLKK